LNELMLEVLADELERLSDPRLGFVTFTGVNVNRDLSKATVYYSTLGGTSTMAAPTDPEATKAALESAGSHLRHVLGREVRVKNVPRLSFVEDPGITGGERIEAILRDIHQGEHGEDAREDGAHG
jgi:ribosome-binding factor A